MTNRKQLASHSNPNKVIYTCIAWHDIEAKLFAGDLMGFVHIIDVYVEDQNMSRQVI
jgi:hypothetical protein